MNMDEKHLKIWFYKGLLPGIRTRMPQALISPSCVKCCNTHVIVWYFGSNSPLQMFVANYSRHLDWDTHIICFWHTCKPCLFLFLNFIFLVGNPSFRCPQVGCHHCTGFYHCNDIDSWAKHCCDFICANLRAWRRWYNFCYNSCTSYVFVLLAVLTSLCWKLVSMSIVTYVSLSGVQMCYNVASAVSWSDSCLWHERQFIELHCR